MSYQKQTEKSCLPASVLLKILWLLFMNGVQLPQGYRTTSRRPFTFHHQVPRKSWKDLGKAESTLEASSRPWRHPEARGTPGLGIQRLNHQAITPLTTRPVVKNTFALSVSKKVTRFSVSDYLACLRLFVHIIQKRRHLKMSNAFFPYLQQVQSSLTRALD